MSDRKYVLGTHDEERIRLGLQHAVWRPAALSAWRRAGFRQGHRLLDIGCGPGFATLDLGDITGSAGLAIGIDRSKRFLDNARARAASHETGRFEFHECDLDAEAIPVRDLDGAWCRWVCCFLARPEGLVNKVYEALRLGGRFVIHEYYDYAGWRLLPPSASFQRFVRAVMDSWHDAGGEANIARYLPTWLHSVGFSIDSVRPIVHAAHPQDFTWRWPANYVRSALTQLEISGHLSRDEAAATRADFDRYETDSNALMMTPAVLEIVATKTASSINREREDLDP